MSNSLVVIIVCASLGGLAVLIALLRIIVVVNRRSHHKPVPLPPIQPLAHHREKHLASRNASPHEMQRTMSSRAPSTWSNSQHSLRTNSTAALLSPYANGISRHSSFHTDDSLGGQVLPESPSSAELTPPHPAFAAGSTSRSSNNSLLSPSESSAYSSAEESDDPSSPTRSTDYPPTPHKRAQSALTLSHRPRPRPRPQSMTLTVSSGLTSNTSRTRTNRSVRSSRSTSNIRGAPHGPFSQVEIIIPTPLAPELYPYTGTHQIGKETDGGGIIRPAFGETKPLSVRDAWLPVAKRDDSMSERSQVNEGSKGPTARIDDGLQAHPSSRSSSLTASSQARSPSLPGTPTSVPSSLRSSPSSTPVSPHPPPVPRIPSMYGNGNAAHGLSFRTEGSLASEPADRGRSRAEPNYGSKRDASSHSKSRTSRSRSTSRPRTLRKSIPISEQN